MSSTSLGTASAKVVLDVSQLSAGVTAAAGHFKQLEGSTAGLSSSLSGVATTLGVIGGGLAVGLGAALHTFGNFEAQMHTLGAVSQATGDDLSKLGDLAKQIGKDTTFGATEAATALTELSKAGVSTEDILAGAGKAAATLAKAGGVGVADAATTMATAMNVFAISGKQAAHVADVFANAANKSAADSSDLRMALSQVGTVAKLAGLSLEDTAGALALLADSELRGSDAGTSLKTALTAMIAPTATAARAMADLGISFTDSQGRFVGLAQAAATLQAALGPLTQAQRDARLAAIFGQDAIRVGAILYDQGAAAVNDYTAAMNQTGTAEAVAAANMHGLNGALEQLQGSVENAAIAIGETLAPGIEKAAGLVAGAADAFAALPASLQQVAAFAGAGAAGLTLMAAGLAKVVGFALSAADDFARLAEAIRASTTAMTLLSGVFSPAGLLVGALAFAIGSLIVIHHQAAEAARAQAEAVKQLADEFRSFQQAISDLKLRDLGTEAQAMTGLLAAITAATSDLTATAAALDAGEKQAAEFGATAGTGAERAQEMRDAVAALNAELPEMQKALAKPGVDIVKLSGFFADLVRQLQAGALAPAAFTARIQDATDHLDRFAVANKDAADKTKQQTTALERQRVAFEKLGQAMAARQKATVEAEVRAAEETRKVREDAVAAAAQSEIDQRNRTQQAIEDSHQRELDRIEEERHAREAAAEKAAQAERDYQRSIDDTIAANIRAIKGIEDIAPALDGVQRGFGRAGDSAAELVRRLDLAGQVDLSPAAEQALILQRRLERLEATGAELHATVAQNRDDYSQWEANIKLVTDVLGGNERAIQDQIDALQAGTISQAEFNAAVADPTVIGTFEKLDALYAQHKISQEQLNEAKAAGVHLLQRSAGGLQDEDAQLVQNLIDLDAYVAKHDDAYGAVQDLSAAQREWLAALQDSSVQTALQTANLVAYLAVANLIPPEKATKVLADISQASPLIHDVFADLGLIPPTKNTDLTATDHATGPAQDAKKAIEDIPTKTTVNLDFAATGDGSELVSGKKGLKLADVAVAAHVEAPDTSAVDAVTIPEKTVKTKLEAPDASAVEAYQPPTIRIGTVLKAPLTDPVDTYTPPTIHLPTTLDAPTNSPFGEGQGKAAALHIPTVIDAPDTTPLDRITAKPITIPAVVGSIDETNLADIAPEPVTIDVVLGTPHYPEGMTWKGPDPVTIDTLLATPDTAKIDDYVPPSITVPVDAETTDFDTKIGDAETKAAAFDKARYTTSIVADATEFDDNFDPVYDSAVEFDNATYTTTLDADAQAALDAIGSVSTAAWALANSFYTVRIGADVGAAKAALQDLADHLPSSPAKKGPLSKEPNFDYVVEAFVAALSQVGRLAEDAAGDFGPRIRTSLAIDEGSILKRGMAGAGAGAAGGPTTIDARTFYALKSDEYARLLADAQRGTTAYDWIGRRETAYATVGG